MAWFPGDLTIVSGDAPPAFTPQRLASHVVDAEQTQHVFYRTSDNQLVELWWKGPDRPKWDFLTNSANQAPLTASSPTSHVFKNEGTQHVFYVTWDNRIVELWWSGGEERVHWGYLTQFGDPVPADSRQLASHVFEDQRTQHVFYRAANGHIIELWWFPSDHAHVEDLTVRSRNAPLASGDPTSHVVDADGTQHVFYTSVDNAMIELWWRPGEQPQAENLTLRSPGAPLALPSTRPTSFVAPDRTQHVFHISFDQHIIELRWFDELPPWRDLLSGLLDTPGEPTSHVFAFKGTQHVFYTNQELHIRHLGLRGNEPPAVEDLMVASGGSPLAIGDPTSHVVSVGENTQHVFYITGEGHIIELWSAD
jgi:hypothetical protein